MNPVVDIQNVNRRFGPKQVLDNVSIRLEPGTVTGLIGENGAGKTTLIKHVLGLLTPDEGSVRVFGLDPVKQPVPVLVRMGYLSEEDMLPPWMKVHQLQRYMQGFYPTWDQAYADQLCRDFNLGRDEPLIKLSKGQKARAGLMAALAYRPELLVLDEPSSGLDPMVRRDILGAVVRLIADEGRTVLFSSHLLAEVDRVADQIAMIKNGRLAFCLGVDELRDTHHTLTVRFANPRPVPPVLAGSIFWEAKGREWSGLVRAIPDQVTPALRGMDAELAEIRAASLEEIFVGYSKSSLAEIGGPK